MVRFASLYEAFETRRFQKGQVIFSNHEFTDKHIQDVINIIANELGKRPESIVEEIEAKINEFEEARKLAPILYETIAQNIIESEIYSLYEKLGHEVTTAPTFNKITFDKLVTAIRTDVKGLFPLRSWTGGKGLWEPVIYFDDTSKQDAKIEDRGPISAEEKIAQHKKTKQQRERGDSSRTIKANVTTAAASPDGTFYFNLEFMQSLINFAHIKGIKPKGKKYVSNGGQIPDEYCYIEFLILHEFLHYTQGDFYYQKIIPDANPTIINWVGDFRSNYMLVKSGYEQLPMGLFNDEINHDRQKTYREMYDLVKAEMEKLKKASEDNGEEGEDGEGGEPGESKSGKGGKGKGKGGKGESIYDKVKKQLDENADEHDIGQEEGKDQEIEGDPTEEELDNHQKKIEKAMEEAEDLSSEEVEERNKEANKSKQPSQGRGGRGSRTRSGGDNQIDYSKVRPTFKWKDLIKKFIFAAKEDYEESYQKIAPKSITGIHVAAQLGKGAISPGELTLDQKDIKLAFIVDSSGSMSSVIAKVYSNIYNLLKTNKSLADSVFTLIKFSSNFEIFKCIFSTDKASKVELVKEKPKNWTLKTSEVFKKFEGSVTNFDSPLVTKIEELIKDGHNVIIFSDSDLTDGENLRDLAKLIKAHTKNVFVIFDQRDSYLKFRQKSGLSNANISYVE